MVTDVILKIIIQENNTFNKKNTSMTDVNAVKCFTAQFHIKIENYNKKKI